MRHNHPNGKGYLTPHVNEIKQYILKATNCWVLDISISMTVTNSSFTGQAKPLHTKLAKYAFVRNDGSTCINLLGEDGGKSRVVSKIIF